MRATTTFTTTLLLTTALVLSGCAGQSSPPESEVEVEVEVEPTQSLELNTKFDRSDPCTLFTGTELAEIIGIAPTGSVEVAETDRRPSPRPYCRWTFNDAGVKLFDIHRTPHTIVDMDVTLESFQSPPQCFGMPCDTPAEYLHAWATDYQSGFTTITPDIVESPHLLSGAVAVHSSGAIFVDEHSFLHFEIYRCASAACANAIIQIQEALDTKLR